ncbi:hypothetical protein BP5796_09689 [Coleophoma crateriformis]|uniref:RRM domain-containing protein n=1 Tax=Coleophoma crateriformis TaxID=565419 RepID=A0A3D8QZ34_9HELO|nr:hypothetical protein BP5796_09689 [Coleophoma crateriformis]
MTSRSASPTRGRPRSRSLTPISGASRSPSRPRRTISPRSESRSPRRNGRYRSQSRSISRSPSPLRSTKVVIEKLTKNVNEDHLREIFGTYGTIRDLDMPMNRQFMTNRGTAYILYASEADAEAAIAHMHESQIDEAPTSTQEQYEEDHQVAAHQDPVLQEASGDLRGTLIHIDHDPFPDPDPRVGTEPGRDHIRLDRDHLQDGEEDDGTVQDGMGEAGAGEAQAIVATAVMMTGAGAEAVRVEIGQDGKRVKYGHLIRAWSWGTGMDSHGFSQRYRHTDVKCRERLSPFIGMKAMNMNIFPLNKLRRVETSNQAESPRDRSPSHGSLFALEPSRGRQRSLGSILTPASIRPSRCRYSLSDFPDLQSLPALTSHPVVSAAINPIPRGLQIPAQKTNALWDGGFPYPPVLDAYGIGSGQWKVFWQSCLTALDQTTTKSIAFNIEGILDNVARWDREYFRPRGLLMRWDMPGEQVFGLDCMDLYHDQHVDNMTFNPAPLVIPDDSESKSARRRKKAIKAKKACEKHRKTTRAYMFESTRVVLDHVSVLDNEEAALTRGWKAWVQACRMAVGDYTAEETEAHRAIQRDNLPWDFQYLQRRQRWPPSKQLYYDRFRAVVVQGTMQGNTQGRIPMHDAMDQRLGDFKLSVLPADNIPFYLIRSYEADITYRPALGSGRKPGQ